MPGKRGTGPDFWRRQVTRRGLVTKAAVSSAGLTAAAIVGCARGDKPVASGDRAMSETTQAKKGGTLRFPSLLLRPPYDRGLDPHVNIGADTGRMRMFYEGLVRADPRSWEVEGELAQNWEQPTPAELVLTLAQGVKFHDKPPANGREMRTSDVVFSLDRVRSPGPRFVVRSLLDTVDQIQAVDASRVRITLKQVDAGIMQKLAGMSLVVLAPEVVEKAGDKFATPDTAVGTGAFILSELTDVSATHVRNPAYWRSGLPHLDQILTPHFQDDQAKWAALQAGALDMMYRVPGTTAAKYKGQPGQFALEGRLRAEWASSAGSFMIFINATRPPFNDPRVYKALRLLVDYDEALKVDAETQRGWGYLSQAFGPALAEWDFTQEEYVTQFLPWKQPKDEAARAALGLLGAAGYTKDTPLKLTISTQSPPTFRLQGELLQAQWRRLSQGAVEPEVRLFPPEQILAIAARREYMAWIGGAAPQAVEPDTALRSFYHSTGSRNYAGWNDPRADELIDRQLATLEIQQRKAAIKDLLRYLIDNAPMAGWVGGYELTAAQPKVKNWAPQQDAWVGGFRYAQVWLDT